MKISDCFGASRVIAFTGLAKNAGKTTAMRAALIELTSNGKCCGVTSSGRDGEAFDVLNQDIPKPQILMPAGSLLATTDRLLAKASTPVRRLESTAYHTPLGRVIIAEILQDGKFEIAGPSTSSGLKVVSQRMLALGAEYTLVDGAINRKAAASPQVCDGVVLSTGAILNPDLEIVVQETSMQADLFRLPQVDDPLILQMFEQMKQLTLVNDDYQTVSVTPPSVLDVGKMSARLIGKTTRWVLIPAAISDYMLEPLAQLNRRQRLTVVAGDSTKIFISPVKLDFYRERGIDLRVIHPIHLLCVTANPVAPASHRFDPSDFIIRLRLAIPNTPVMDVISEMASPV